MQGGNFKLDSHEIATITEGFVPVNFLTAMLSPELLRSLSDPKFYPHPSPDPIEVIQTHISAVFLTGDFAYKLKKPVNFGFLDFSTLEKRHYFLDRELVMNQPVAPELYLEVLPITSAQGQLSLDGAGEVVDYVLKMRQFPQDSLLSNRLVAGQITESDMVQLGKVVAEFHRQTQTNLAIQAFGNLEQIGKAIADNYRQTERYIGIAQTQQQFAETEAFTRNFLQQKSTVFQQRQNQQKIRECHGDLHLSNICFWNGKFHLFDRIEFNEEFRFVDVIYDIAFTIVDLDVHSRLDLSNRFLNSYLEQTGDWEGVQVLPFYLCRQAYVRAKVQSILLDDPNISPHRKSQALAAAVNFYHLAWQYTQPSVGRLIIMSGLSGSGKSTVARQIAPQLKAIHLRSDAVRKHLAQIELSERGKADLYSAAMTERTYARLLELGILLVRQGFTIILDGKFDRQRWRESAIQSAISEGLSLTFLQCVAPLAVLRDRILHRQGDISDATPDLLEAQLQQAEPFTASEQAHAIALDTTQTPQALADQLHHLFPPSFPSSPISEPRSKSTMDSSTSSIPAG